MLPPFYLSIMEEIFLLKHGRIGVPEPPETIYTVAVAIKIADEIIAVATTLLPSPFPSSLMSHC